MRQRDRLVRAPEVDGPAVAPSAPVRRPSLLLGLLRTARPRQWVKNVLVFAAPGAAGVLTQREPLLRSLAAFALFCVTASGTYFLNDALDHVADRLHPRKRHRPVAAEVVPVGLAKTLGLALVGAAIATALLVGLWRLALVLGIYGAVTISYSLWLKEEPVIDLAAVASGFVLRTVAGGAATGIPISHWFLIVASFGSLFMVAGKRHAEHLELGDDSPSHRATLSSYSRSYLHYIRSLTSAVTISSYCLWAFEKADAAGAGVGVWFELSIVPFVLGILRYALLLDRGQGGAPEDIVLADRALQVIGLAWVVTFCIGIYGR